MSAATVEQRLADVAFLAERVADEYDDVREVTDLATVHTPPMIAALRAVLAMHTARETFGPNYYCPGCARYVLVGGCDTFGAVAGRLGGAR